MSFKAGDTVYHRPTGETWVLAATDGDEVYPCGWPETIAKASDCELKKSATLMESMEMLRRWASKTSGVRESAARHLLGIN